MKQGPGLAALLRAAAPTMLLYLLLAVCGTIVLLCAGRFCGPEGLLIAGTGGACTILVCAVLAAQAQTMAAAIHRRVGQNDLPGAGRLAGLAVRRMALTAVIFVVVLELLARPVLFLLYVPYSLTDSYPAVLFLRINLIAGLCFAVLCIVFCLLRSADAHRGLPWRAGLAAVIAAAVAGPLLSPGLGILGAALTAVIALAAAAVTAALLLRRRTLPFTRQKGSKEDRGELVLGGRMSVLQNVCLTGSFLVVNAAANHLGVDTGAGYAAATAWLPWVMIIPAGLRAGVRTLTQAEPEQQSRILGRAVLVGAVAGVVLLVLILLCREAMPHLFTADMVTAFQAACYLKGWAPDALLLSLLFCFSGAFEGAGQRYLVRFQVIFSSLVFRIAFSLLLPRTMDLPMQGLGFASPIASIYGLLFSAVCFFALAHFRKKRRESEEQ